MPTTLLPDSPHPTCRCTDAPLELIFGGLADQCSRCKRFRHLAVKCMEDDCLRVATWRSDDGYPFCREHAYAIYCAECELENLVAHTVSLWTIHGRPHGPLGHAHAD